MHCEKNTPKVRFTGVQKSTSVQKKKFQFDLKVFTSDAYYNIGG